MSAKMTSQNKLTEIKLVPYNKPYLASSCFWQDLQDLTLLGGMCIPFQYFTNFIVFWRLEWLRY
jgi:hypothetical protein